VNNESESMWKEEIVLNTIPSLAVGIEKHREKPQSGIPVSGSRLET
jgi:hypothetical protein